MIGRRRRRGRGRAPWGGWRGCARRAAAPPRAPARAPRRCAVGETAPAPAQTAPDRTRPRPAPPRAHPRPHRPRRRGRPGTQHPTPCRAPAVTPTGCRVHTPGGLRGAHARAARCALRRAGAATPRAGSAAGPRRVVRPARVSAPRRPPPPPPPAPRVGAAHLQRLTAWVPGRDRGAGLPAAEQAAAEGARSALGARARGGSAGARGQGLARTRSRQAARRRVCAGGATPPGRSAWSSKARSCPSDASGAAALSMLCVNRGWHTSSCPAAPPPALSGQRPVARPWRAQGAARASKAAQRLCSWLQSSACSSSEYSACATRARLRAAQAAARSLRRYSRLVRGTRGAPRPRRRGGASPPRTPQALRESGPPLATARRRQASRATDAQRKSADSWSEPGPRVAREARAGGTWTLR
jgi:hypothetical protein